MATTENKIVEIVKNQRQFFRSGKSKDYDFRIDILKKLKKALAKFEPELNQALKQDLGKPEFEAYISETGFIQQELTETIKKLKQWMKPHRTLTSLLTQPASSKIYFSPLGVNLIIAPYNYPVMLTFSPLVAAIAAGNTAVVKTSEITPSCSTVIKTLIEETFDSDYIAYIDGEVPETTILLQQQFDHIFFTGSPRVGSIVMAAAAKHLTKVTLELGGKSPCIIHEDAKLDIAVNRVVNGKFLNAGQTCVAPDYVMVHKDVKEEFLSRIKNRIIHCYGPDASKSPDFGRIVSDAHFQRIKDLIDPEKVLVGGEHDAETRFIAPTVLRDITLDDEVMAGEIFGPVLPVLEYQTLDEVYKTVDQLPHYPLACYIFSENSLIQQKIIHDLQFGGGSINNCVFHAGNSHLPFGGVGESGMGAYHGFYGFECFSHKKGVLKSATWIDLPLIYAPYRNKIKLLRRVLK